MVELNPKYYFLNKALNSKSIAWLHLGSLRAWVTVLGVVFKEVNWAIRFNLFIGLRMLSFRRVIIWCDGLGGEDKDDEVELGDKSKEVGEEEIGKEEDHAEIWVGIVEDGGGDGRIMISIGHQISAGGREEVCAWVLKGNIFSINLTCRETNILFI